MITIYAPYPMVKGLIYLPDPELGDSERPESQVAIQVAMSGKKYTHIKTTTNRSYRWMFNLTRQKAIELYYFFEATAHEQWKVVLADTTELIGYIKLNPLSLSMEGRGVLAGSNDKVPVEVEFEKCIV